MVLCKLKDGATIKKLKTTLPMREDISIDTTFEL
jgi:hypothetical protein